MLETKRLILRQWCNEDLEPFAKMNADPKVREYFAALLTKEESDASVKIAADHIARFGWGFWAASLKDTGEFIGFIGIEDVYFKAPFSIKPAVEIGWRLATPYWGKGYATEGAKASLQYGFEVLNLEEIVAFTVPGNTRSQNVMKKIGMHRDPKDDFDHPKVPIGHPMIRHVLYRITQAEWKHLTKGEKR